MKFLCDHCKAKYQIPDEKIAGRTLRMKCRKCGHDIVIRGPRKSDGAKPASTSQRSRVGGSPTGRRRTVGSHAGPRPRKSALGAEFRRSGAPAAAEPPPRQLAEWYVAINEVPVGPIKREEVARKIATGAVNEESLCWREGFDDWIALREVPELMALLKQRRGAPPLRSSRPAAPPAKAGPSNVVPIGGRLGAAAAPALEDFGFDEADEKTVMAPMPAAMESPAAAPAKKPTPAPVPAPVPPPAAPAPAAPASAAPASVAPAPAPTPPEPSAPAATASSGPAASPAVTAEPAAASVAAPAPPPPAPAEPLAPPPPAPAERRRLPVGAWIAMVGAGCFGIAFAVVLANKMLAEDEPAPAAEASPEAAVAEEPPAQVEAQVDLNVPVETEEEPASTEDPEGEGSTEAVAAVAQGQATRPARASMRAAGTMTATGTMGGAELSEAQRRLLAQLTMDDGTSGTPGMIVARGTMSGSSMRAALDGQAVSRVVNARSNRAALQRCYNRAIRGIGEPPDVRLDVSVRVGASGSVTSVSTTGDDFGGLKSCVQQTVRRWRFPPSAGGGETRFPLVFSAPG